MPTALPRHQITETPAVAAAIDLAARLWPDEPRSKLLLRLIDAGAHALQQSEDLATERRHAAIAASSGKYTAAFGPEYLSNLRQDWPE